MKTIYFSQRTIPKLIYEMKTLYLIGISLYKSKGLYQVFLIASTALSLQPLLDSFQKYLTPNFDYVAIWVILMIADVASGLYKHSGIWSKEAENTLSKDEFFFKLMRKMFASAIWLVLINVVENYSEIASEHLDLFGIGVLMAWLIWSIASNLYVITGSTFPPEWVMNRLKKTQTKKEENE